MKCIALIILILYFGKAKSFWRDCPESSGVGPDDIISPNCSGDRCLAVRGETMYARLYATPQSEHHELRIRVTAFIFGIGINLPMVPPFDDGCSQIYFSNGTSTNCPVFPNVQYLINVEMPISPLFPAFVNTTVQVEFIDRGVLAACGKIIADII